MVISGFMNRFEEPTCNEQAEVVEMAILWLRETDEMLEMAILWLRETDEMLNTDENIGKN